MSQVLLALGPAVFYAAAPSFETIRTRVEGRWAEQERLSRAPAQQFLGPAASIVTLEGVMMPHALGGLGTIVQLQQMIRAGKPLPLISMGVGSLLGVNQQLWVPLSIDDTRKHFDTPDPRRLQYTLELKEYGSDRGGLLGGLFR